MVSHAVVRTGFDVHQVMAGGGVELAVHLHHFPARVELHGGGAVVLLLQRVSHLAEVGQLQPAGLEAAGARHAVALAGHVGEV